jgi:hypothetical protein
LQGHLASAHSRRIADQPASSILVLYFPRSGSRLCIKHHRGFWLSPFCKAFRFRDTILALTSPTRCTILIFLHLMSAFMSLLLLSGRLKKLSLLSLARSLLPAPECFASLLHFRHIHKKTTKHTWLCHGSDKLFSIHFITALADNYPLTSLLRDRVASWL